MKVNPSILYGLQNEEVGYPLILAISEGMLEKRARMFWQGYLTFNPTQTRYPRYEDWRSMFKTVTLTLEAN